MEHQSFMEYYEEMEKWLLYLGCPYIDPEMDEVANYQEAGYTAKEVAFHLIDNYIKKDLE